MIQNPSSNKKLVEINSKTLSRYSKANNKLMLITILVLILKLFILIKVNLILEILNYAQNEF